jgi:type III secretion protein T
MVLAAKESLIGVGLGIALSMPFWSVMIAGGLMDQQRGQSNLMLEQPGGGEQISATATILLIAAIVVYATSGGLESFVSTLYDSWTVWRPMDVVPVADRSAPILILELADAVMRRGFELALPAIFAMLLGDAAMLIIVRIAPQIHLDNVMSALRNLVFAIFLPLYLGYLVYYNHQDQIVTAKAIEILKPILHPTHEGLGMFP